MIYSMRVRLSHMMIFCLAPVIACCSGGAWQSLDKAEALLQAAARLRQRARAEEIKKKQEEKNKEHASKSRYF